MTQRPGRRYSGTIRRPVSTEVELLPERPRRRVLPLQSLPLLLLGGFAAMIAVGWILLMLPVASADGDWTPPLIALFVSTSAVCVTGLVPVDTGTYWSGFGHAVILTLIQLGGLGFMTSATLLFLLFGWRVGLRERKFLSESLDLSRIGDIVSLTRRAVIFTLVAECAGFVILSAWFATDEPLGRSLWWGLFHSVSAFNNAGFDVMGNFRSFEEHADVVTLGVTSALFVIGGIGFLVVEVLIRAPRTAMLTLDAKLVLRTTAALLVAGFALFLLFEWDTTLAGRDLPDKVLHSWFHAATPRTAGFNSLPVGEMTDETQFVTMALMFIGGGSGSTAGGIKVATFAILLAAVFSAVRGREHVEAAGREVRPTDVHRALAVAFLGTVLIFTMAVLLAYFQEQAFLPILFETTSAFGTVGLSTGITPDLTDPGLVIITIMMFVGRLGPLTLVLALVQRAQITRRRLPEERIRIG